MVEAMFRGSRAPWSRYEDRCDGAGSEAEGAKPPVKPGPLLPVLGVLVFGGRSALVKPPSSGLRNRKARRPPGAWGPAIRTSSQSSLSEVQVRSIWLARHKGGPGRCSSCRRDARMAGEGEAGWEPRRRDGLGAATG